VTSYRADPRARLSLLRRRVSECSVASTQGRTTVGGATVGEFVAAVSSLAAVCYTDSISGMAPAEPAVTVSHLTKRFRLFQERARSPKRSRDRNLLWSSCPLCWSDKPVRVISAFHLLNSSL
jgi:hypothetical protein